MSYGYSPRPHTKYQHYTWEESFLLGTRNLRDGKGSVYVKSAGNGFSGYNGWICGSAISLGITCEN